MLGEKAIGRLVIATIDPQILGLFAGGGEILR